MVVVVLQFPALLVKGVVVSVLPVLAALIVFVELLVAALAVVTSVAEVKPVGEPVFVMVVLT